MHKFEIGQIVRGADGRLYKVDDTAVDKNGQPIYLLKEVFYRFKYDYDNNLEAFYGEIVNDNELRSW